MSVRANAKEPLAHRFKSSHLLDAVRVEVLKLQPLRGQHPANELAGGDREAVLVEDHERHHVPTGWAWHGLIGGDDPLDGLGKERQLARLDEMKEFLAGDVGACPVRHLDNKVLDGRCGCGRTRSTEGECGRKKKQKGRQGPKPALDARL
jgi:hypothetical protein